MKENSDSEFHNSINKSNVLNQNLAISSETFSTTIIIKYYYITIIASGTTYLPHF
jgi:hypothetical protein